LNLTLPTGLTLFQRGWLSANNVLLQDSHQAILVDTGYWTHSAQTLDLVRSRLGPQPLTQIINTHLHSDHCGGNAALQSAFPALETLVPPGHANFVFDWDPASLTYTPTGQYCPQFTADGVISSGDRFTVAHHEWLVLAAPGHDPHSVILYCEETGVLISADALWENGFGVVFPEIEGIEAFDEVGKTLDLIESLNVTLVIPGHGAVFQDIAVALTNARSRLASFRADPRKHASYAAKVLIKFKLLELQTTQITMFQQWAYGCDYLKTLQYRYAPHQQFDAWLDELLASLEKGGAIKRTDSVLTNI
jgi:glyoxylase-like metal-dependent hydrolase (beta-lactamase superfamily II)